VIQDLKQARERSGAGKKIAPAVRGPSMARPASWTCTATDRRPVATTQGSAVTAAQPHPKIVSMQDCSTVLAVPFSDAQHQCPSHRTDMPSLPTSEPPQAASFAATPRKQVENEHAPFAATLYLEVLQQLQSAIEMLDRMDAPGQIAAHIDLAMHQLQDAIDGEIAGAKLDQIERKAAPQ
jgi:hypothetical protein